MAYSTKIFAQFLSKVIFVDRFKGKGLETKKYVKGMKYTVPGLELMVPLAAALSSSVVTLLMTYPFDMAYARIAGTIKKDGHYNRVGDTFHPLETEALEAVPKSQMKKPQVEFFLRKYYLGLPAALFQSLIFSTLTLCGYQLLQYKLENLPVGEHMIKENYMIRYIKIFGATSLIGFIASVCSYPFDTLKRQFQVNGARGYALQHRYFYEGLQKFMLDGPMKYYK